MKWKAALLGTLFFILMTVPSEAAFKVNYYSYVMGNARSQSAVMAIEETYLQVYQMLENGYPYPMDPVAAAEADGVITDAELGYMAAVKDFQESQGQWY